MPLKLELLLPSYCYGTKYSDWLQMYGPGIEERSCDVEDQEGRERLLAFKTKMDEPLGPDDPKNFIKVIAYETNLDSVNFDFRILSNIMDWKILSDKHRHNGLKIKCSGCGNWMLNPDFQTQFNPKTIWKKKPCFALNSTHFILARDRFVEEFKRQGFTGVTFNLFLEVEDRYYYQMEIVQHEWNNRSGVCRTCGMKTNVIREAYFNLPEKYLYDFQRLEYNINAIDSAGTSGMYDQRIAMSQRAVNFMFKYTDPFCNPAKGIPIMPGYLSDIIWPEDRMFTDGDYPDSVLRKV